MAGTANYTQSHALRLVSLITLSIASFFTVVPIVVLYFVQNMKLRLGIVGIFTVLFTAALGLVSDTRKLGIIAASAGYTIHEAILHYVLADNLPVWRPSRSFSLPETLLRTL